MIPSARRKFDAESNVLQGFSSQRVHQNGHINSHSGRTANDLIPGEPSTIRDAGSTIRDVGSTIRDAGSTIRDANARSVLALTKIWRSLLARQLIVG